LDDLTNLVESMNL